MAALMEKALLYLTATSWLLQASNGQEAACFHVYTFDAPEFSDVDGCFVRSEEYTSLGQPIYTDDEGDVDSGSTIAIMGAYVSATNTCRPHQAVLSQSCYVWLVSCYRRVSRMDHVQRWMLDDLKCAVACL